MWRNKKMRWILILCFIALLGFTYYNYVEDWRNPRASFVEEEQQPYVTAEVDTTISKNLDRPLQEVVNIDMEEHKEQMFFTWEDVKAYYRVAVGAVKDFLDKK